LSKFQNQLPKKLPIATNAFALTKRDCGGTNSESMPYLPENYTGGASFRFEKTYQQKQIQFSRTLKGCNYGKF